jgi:hypothetical protein
LAKSRKYATHCKYFQLPYAPLRAALAPWASRRRHDLLELLDRLNPTITELTGPVTWNVWMRKN